jgi:hypothetical protein
MALQPDQISFNNWGLLCKELLKVGNLSYVHEQLVTYDSSPKFCKPVVVCPYIQVLFWAFWEVEQVDISAGPDLVLTVPIS